MTDESDETKRVPPVDDATQPDLPRADDTRPDLPKADDTRPDLPKADDTVPDGTAVLPSASPASSDDEWASSRAKPVWSGRAEVRGPRTTTSYDTDWSDDGPVPAPVQGQRDRWWMPIVVGIIVLILLGVLAWAIYLIVQSSGEQESPAITPSATATTISTPSSAPTTAPTTSAPVATTTPTDTPSTTEPTTTAVTVPALRGLALDDARAALDRTGLRYRVLYRDSTAPPGTVIDSDPAEGQEVPPDTRVTIVVSQQGTPTTTPTATATTPTTAATA